MSKSDDRGLFANKAEKAADGTVRKAHYRVNDKGEQPWDTTKRLGWSREAAAFCVLRYLRRDKDEAHSLESARWYYKFLLHAVAEESTVYPRPGSGPTERVLTTLDEELTVDELLSLDSH